MSFAEEDAMLGPMEKYWRRKGYRVLSKVNIMGRHHDVVAWNPRTKDLVVVELKLNKWKRALHQALFPRLWCNAAFIALPASAISLVERHQETISTTGIGVMLVAPNRVRVLVPALRKKPGSSSSRRAALSAFNEQEP